MKHRSFFSVLLFIVLSLALVGCGPESADETVVVPTRTPRPTFTPTPVQVSQIQVTATFTPVPAVEAPAAEQPAQEAPSEAASEAPADPPTATPVPQPASAQAVVTNDAANLRTGPSTEFTLAGTVNRGTQFEIIGKNPAGDWWQVCCVNGQNGWIAAFLVDTSGPVDSVAVAANIPAPPPTNTPAPVPPTNTPVPAQPTEPPAPTFSVNKAQTVEPRPNDNAIVTFFGMLCQQVCVSGGPASGYTMVVEGPSGRVEAPFEGGSFRHGNPGLESEFFYNVKLEIPGAPSGPYRAFVTDGAGNQVSEAWEYTASGNIRTFLPRWVVP